MILLGYLLFAVADIALYMWGIDYRPRSWWRVMPGSGFYAAFRRTSQR